MIGLGWPVNGTIDSSLFQRASKLWAEPVMGLFLSRHNADPTEEKGLEYKDSKLMLG